MKKFTKPFSLAALLFVIGQPASSQQLFKDLTIGMETSGSNTFQAGSYPENFSNIGSTMYFAGKDKVSGSPNLGYQLYKTDGTPAGTSLVKVLGSNISLNNLAFGFFDFNGITVFVNRSNGGNPELWKTDGTPGGTTLIKSFLVTNVANDFPQGFCVVGSTLFFSANNGNGVELWKSDGTAGGTMEVIDLWTGSQPPPFGSNSGVMTASSKSRMTAFNGKVYFWGYNGTTQGLFVSDGSAAGTTLVKAVSTPGDNFYKVFNSQLFFNDANGRLWKSDGTAGGTATISGVANINSIILFNNNMYVAGTDLYKTDGTVAGTQMLFPNTGIIKGANSNAFYMHDLSAIPPKYYVSDGTAIGTGTVSWRVGAGASFDVINNKMYVTRSDTAVVQSYNNSFLWETDGTFANSAKLISFNAGVHVFNNSLFYQFYNATAGNEPWIYTPSGATITGAPYYAAPENRSLTIFPNPASEKITIAKANIETGESLDLTLFTTMGKQVKSAALSASTNNVELTDLQPGLYLYTVSSGERVVQSGKLIIQ